MAIDMKELIAKEALKMVFEKKAKKLTVTDIVKACNITRQAFSYHFSDIPELLQWIIRQKSDQILGECQALENREEQIRRFLLLAVNAHPAVRSGLNSNYGQELEELLLENLGELFRRLIRQQGLLQTCAPFEQELLIRYHSYAVTGLLRRWDEKDTENLDEIAHVLCKMVVREMPA